MADRVRIRVCVVALRHGQHSETEPTIRTRLESLAPGYDVLSVKKVYGESPDEWRPFAGGKQVREYFADASLSESSASRLLQLAATDESALDSLVQEVDLYIFDPAFLALQGTYTDLFGRLDGSIRSGNKHFCIIMPDSIPDDLASKLEELCAKHLPLLRRAFREDGRGEWMANTELRFRAYLGRVRREKAGLPSSEALSLAQFIFENRGVMPIDLRESPKFVVTGRR